jgi:hypothetical protein
MADSAFWRDLAPQFLAMSDFRADGTYVIGSGAPWNWQLAGVGNDLIRSTFKVLACRGAAEIPSTGVPGRRDVWLTDLLIVWLEELRKRGLNFRFTGEANELLPDGKPGTQYHLGTLHGVCQASATLCKIFEAQAVQAESEEKERNDPKNWSPFRREFEAFTKIKKLREEPPEEIPEWFVRNAIARIDGIEPEQVTRKRIMFEIAGLVSSIPRPIKLIPDESPLPAPEVTPEIAQPATNTRLDPKALRDSYLANFPEEKIKIRDLCWAAGQHYREWKRWLAGEMKDGSTADLAFRRVLTSGKRPDELAKKPRPHGWE